jgi:DNA polymerase III subunit delta'
MKKSNLSVHWPHIGNDHIIEFLEKSISNERIAQAYIFHGPDNLGKTSIAKWFAKTLLCEKRAIESAILPCESCISCRQFQFGSCESSNSDSGQERQKENIIHSDYFFINRRKDKKNISIDDIRELIRFLNLSPFFNSYKVGLIKHAESMSEEAHNALLKTLEEPKQRVVVVLAANNLDSIPKTILSRCQILNFHLVKTEYIYDHLVKTRNVTRSLAKELSRLCLGRPALALKWLENKASLHNYTARADLFIDLYSMDINERIDAIEKFLPRSEKGQVASKTAQRIIEVWEGVARDGFLIDTGHKDRVHYYAGESKINQIGKRMDRQNIISLLNSLRQAKDYLRTNSNPKSVLENIAINLF